MKKGRYTLKMYMLRVRDGPAPRQNVMSVQVACDVIRPYFEALRDDREKFVAVALTSRNALLGIAEIAVGGVSSASVDLRVIFRTLLVMGAARFILAHNHPSGDSEPSADDVAFTKRLGRGARLLGLDLVDHLIVADGTGQVSSLAERKVVTRARGRGRRDLDSRSSVGQCVQGESYRGVRRFAARTSRS